MRAVVIGSALGAAWIVCAGSVEIPELAAGAATACLAAFLLEVSELRALARIAPSARLFAQARYLPLYALTGTYDILAVLARHLAGARRAPSLLAASPYSATGDDALDATRRALCTTYTTITPNFVVIDVDCERGLLLFHQLEETPTPKMTLALGAEA